MTEPEWKKWKIFMLVAVSTFMSTLDSSIVNIALPYMMQDFKTDIDTIQWVVLVYLVVVSCFLLTFGRLSDIKGRKPVYVTGFTLFAAGSFLCAEAGSAEFLIIARAFQGCGASMLMACSPALVVDVFPDGERGKALGMLGAVVAAGLTVGPVAGGMILEYFSWRFIFYINIPIGIAAAIAALVFLKTVGTPRGNYEPMDGTGSVLLVVMLSALIIFVTGLTRWGVVSFKSLASAGIFIVASFGFIVTEKNSDFPLFDMKLLKIRLFVLPVAASCILFAALFDIVFMMPFYLTYPCGFSASMTGGIMITPFLFLLVVSPVSGMMYDRFGSRILCVFGMVLLTLSLVCLATLEPSMGVTGILWRMALAGIGTAFFVSPNNTAVMSCVPVSRRGIASGAVATARNLGMVMGVAFAGLVFSTSFSGLTHGATLETYHPWMQEFFMLSFGRTMKMGAVLAFAGIIVSFARGKEILGRT
jgi:EmrB/QacA subfamily drug resistance transporter